MKKKRGGIKEQTELKNQRPTAGSKDPQLVTMIGNQISVY
jgi:hypothetical protein